MQIFFTSFNYKPSLDVSAAEKEYLEHHVPLAKQLPGLRMYLVGRSLPTPGVKSRYYRTAIWAFDNSVAAAKAVRGEVGQKMREHGAELWGDIRSIGMDAEVIVPFDSRRPGQKCFTFAGEFDLKRQPGQSLTEVELRYYDHHVGLARQFPGLRSYIIGRTYERTAKSDHSRMVLLIFDSADALKEAYRSPLGQEVAKDEDASIAKALEYHLDTVVEV